jgi:ribulose 1,5-bisphosphate synthetase/thiazole synthase
MGCVGRGHWIGGKLVSCLVVREEVVTVVKNMDR